MTARKAATKKRTPDPVDSLTVASNAADDFIDILLMQMPGEDGAAEKVLHDAFDRVSRVLESEWSDAHGGEPVPEDMQMWRIGTEAGYLIGVQVGLRLRANGGAR